MCIASANSFLDIVHTQKNDTSHLAAVMSCLSSYLIDFVNPSNLFVSWKVNKIIYINGEGLSKVIVDGVAIAKF